jgi:hypothetical protein
MKKLQLFDCCGAYHVHNFWVGPQATDFVSLWNQNTYREQTHNMRALDILEMMSGPTGHVLRPDFPAGCCYNNTSPGIMTAILNSRQNNAWRKHLLRLGWQLAVNNVRNNNSNNRLFLWTKISRPHTDNNRTFRFVSDGAPYTGPVRDLGGTYARVRRTPGAPLEHIEVVSTDLPPLIVNG